jgi:WD40 repeat protein
MQSVYAVLAATPPVIASAFCAWLAFGDNASKASRADSPAYQMPSKSIVQPGGVDCLVFSPDCNEIASSSVSGAEVAIWDMASRKKAASLKADAEHPIGALVFAANKKILVMGGLATSIRIWNWQSGEQWAIGEAHRDLLASLALSPDGKTLASGGGFRDHTVNLWSFPKGQKRAVLRGHRGYIYSLAFSPDGRTLASGRYVSILV